MFLNDQGPYRSSGNTNTIIVHIIPSRDQPSSASTRVGGGLRRQPRAPELFIEIFIYTYILCILYIYIYIYIFIYIYTYKK